MVMDPCGNVAIFAILLLSIAGITLYNLLKGEVGGTKSDARTSMLEVKILWLLIGSLSKKWDCKL